MDARTEIDRRDGGQRPRLIINAFLMNTGSHIQGGQWRRPEAEQHRFNELQLWQDLARELEEAKFDAMFFADVVGLYGNHNGGWADHLRHGLQIPSNDPIVLLSALAATTKDIGLAATSSVIQSHPFQFARQMSTLDHLSGGRVGWNIVTSALENAHRNFGGAGLESHDDRYVWADEYMEVVYKLWEGSWADGALHQDKAAGIFSDPAGVAKIHHEGRRYSVEGPHLTSPSAQRTPLLFQAGASARGQEFCATHAEATFTALVDPAHAQEYTTAVRDRAEARGRSRGSIRFLQGFHIIVGSTEAEVRRKTEDLDSTLDLDSMLAHIGGGMGVDFGGLPLDTRMKDLTTQGAQGHLEATRRAAGTQDPTLEDFIRYRAINNRLSGTPEQIADVLEQWQDAGIDGINLVNSTVPGTYTDIIQGLLPELRHRGLAQSEYAPGTLRRKLTGQGDRLPEDHPAARYRGGFRHYAAAITESSREQSSAPARA
ncbi:NtaA/DmoA family FMN-dependent monooxygenase [Cellulosimicrobium funkei]|nr:NtaA/DmoA family FMN-dependent monooxygenase [Cellulosimicrobium funkei]